MNAQEKSNRIIQSMIDNVKRHQSKLYDSVQLCAVTILCHAAHYGDYRKADDLVSSLGNGTRASSLVKWFEAFGGFKKSAKGFQGWNGKQFIIDNLASAKATPWHTMEKEVNPYIEFNAEQELKKLIVKYRNIKAKAASMDDEAKSHIHLGINDQLIQELVSLVSFETIMVTNESNDFEAHENVANVDSPIAA